jgi:hypothetical protein
MSADRGELGASDVTELSFKGKEFVYNHHLAVPFRPLEPHPKKGIGPVAFDGNLVIHGDNLHALKALMPMYAGKVDCIFIDPPYNTGNEGWAYNDNVNAPMIKEWLDANPIGIEDGLSRCPEGQEGAGRQDRRDSCGRSRSRHSHSGFRAGNVGDAES